VREFKAMAMAMSVCMSVAKKDNLLTHLSNY